MARRTSLRRRFTNLFSRESRAERKNRWLDLFPRRFTLSSTRTSADVSLLTSLFRRLFVQDRLRAVAVASSSRWAPKFETLEERRLLAHDALGGVDPTDIFVDGSNVGDNVTENSSDGVLVGKLTAEDLDVGDSHTFSLTDDAGGRFRINGNNLLVNRPLDKDGNDLGNILDHETDASHSITIEVMDSQGHTLSKVLTIDVDDINEAPTDITIDNNSVDENSPNDTVVGTLATDDVDAVDSTSFTLTDDAGGRFKIVGADLQVADGSKLDFEADTEHVIKVRVEDSGGLSVEKELTIQVNNLLTEGPTNITLTNSNVDENSGAGLIGGFSVADDDLPGDSHTLTLTNDAGGRFEIINGDELHVKAGAVLNFEADMSHDIEVEAKDQDGNVFSKTLTVNVNDLNEGPTDVLIDNASIDENSANGTTVGVLSAVDEDLLELHSFALDDDAGGRFTLDGNILKVADGSKLDAEAGGAHIVTVTATDKEGETTTKMLTITVNDVNDAPTDVTLTGTASPDPASVDENSAGGTLVGTLSATDQDAGDSHTFTMIDGAGDRFEIVNGNEVRVKDGASLDFETDASHDIIVEAKDAAGLTFQKTLTIAVNDLAFENVAPTDILLSGTSVDENSPGGTVIGVLSAVDGNPEDTIHSFTILEDPSGFFEVVDILDGADPPNVIRSELQVKDGAALDFESNPSHVIKIEAKDAGGLTTEKEFTITVNDLTFENVAPSDIDLVDGDGNSISGNVNENSAEGTVVGNLTVTDANLPADSHTFTLANDAGGRFKAVGTQLQVVGNLDFETSTSHTVRVRVEDAGGLSYEEDFTVTLNDVNDAPTDITLDNASVNENASNGTLVGTLVVDDVDIVDSQTFTLLSDADGRFELVGDNEIRVKDGSKLNFEADESHVIRVRVVDNSGEAIERDLTISVNNLNEAPTGVTLTPSAVEGPAPDGTVVGVLGGIDQDAGEIHRFSNFSDPSGIFKLVDIDDGDAKDPQFVRSEIQVIDGKGGLLDFETQPSHTITLDITDADGTGNTLAGVSVTINVIDENETPFDILLTGPNSVNENSANDTVVGNLLVGDPDIGDSHVLTLDDDAGGRFKISGIKLQVADGSLLNFEAKDGDGNPIGLSHDITVRATDAGGLFYTEVFTIDVNDVNESPSDITLSNSSVNENSGNGTVVGTLSMADEDGDAPTFMLLDDAGGRFSLSGNDIVVADGSLLDFESATSHQVKVSASDGVNDAIERTLTITVKNINEAPTDIALSPSSIQEDSAEGTIVGSLTVTDVDNPDSHVFTMTDPSGFFELAGTLIRVKKDAMIDFEVASSHVVNIKAVDSGGLSVSKDITITVNDLNVAPTDIILGGNGTVNENASNGTVVGGLAAVDVDNVDGDTHTFAFVVVGEGMDAVTLNADGRFGIDGSNLVVADGSKLDFEADTSHDVTIRVTDSAGHTFDKTFTITVNDLDNEPPVAIALSSSSVDENSGNGTLVAILSAVDADLPGDSHTFAIAKDGMDNLLDADGRFELSGNQLLVKDGSKLNFEDADSHEITLTVTDAGGLSFTGPITIMVNDINDAPTDITIGAPGTVSENAAPGTLVGTLMEVDPDATDAHAFGLLDSAGGRFALVGDDIVVADGSLIDFDDATSHDIDVLVVDSGGATFEKTLTIPVVDQNEAPTDILVNPANVAEDVANGTTVGFVTVIDPDALDAHAVTLLDNAGGRFGLVGVGTLVVLDSSLLDFETQSSHDITLRAVDSQGLSVMKTVTITIDDANDAPTGVTLSNMSVHEGVANGTVVGALTAIDPDAADMHTFSLTNDAGGRFGIDGSNLVVADGSLLDFATNPSHDIVVTAIDSGGQPAVGLFTIDVLEFVNNAPTVVNPPADVTVDQDADPSVIDISGVFDDVDIPLGDALTIDASSGDDSLVVVSLAGNDLTLTYGAGASGETDITLQATDLAGESAMTSFSVTVVPDTGPSLQVTGLTPTASGFDVQLNRPIDTSVLNLFVDAPDVTLEGSGGPVAGSLILGDSDDQFSFVATGGVLSGDVYTVTLVSGASAIVDLDGNTLDGNSDGTAGDNFTSTIVVDANSDRIVSVPDMARGPGQAVNVPADGTGLPVMLSDGDSVNSVDFTLHYDPAKLDITAVNVGSDLPGDWSVVSNLSAPATPGVLNVTAFGVSMLSGSDLEVVSLESMVPDSASFGSAQVLGVNNVVVGTNSGFVDASGDQAVHKLAYQSDVDGDFFHSAFDAGLIAGVVVGNTTGFAGFELADPVILANSTGTGLLNGLDASWVAQKSVGIVRPEIADLPAIAPAFGSGIDPLLSISQDIPATAGGSVSVPVGIDDAAGLQGFNVVINYDTAVLDLDNSSVSLGALLAGVEGSAWSLVPNVNDATGTARLALFRSAPMDGGSGEAIVLDFNVAGDAAEGSSAIDISGPPALGGLAFTYESGSVLVEASDTIPTVENILVGSTEWTEAPFADGMTVTGDSAPLPWTNIDQVKAVFSESVNVGLNDLSLTGINVSEYGVASFAWDADTNTATWTLDSAIGPDRLQIDLPDSILSDAGFALDGDGDGNEGGNFELGLNVLPGDGNQDGDVDARDVQGLRASILTDAGDAGYVEEFDFDGSGSIDIRDLQPLRDSLLSTLPDAPATEPASEDSGEGESVAVVASGLTIEVANTTNDSEQTDKSFAALSVDLPVTQESSTEEIAEESYFADLGETSTSASTLDREALGSLNLEDSISDIAGDVDDQWEN